MTVYADGALLNAPAHSFVAGEAVPLSLYHIGYRYGLYTTASYDCDELDGALYVPEGTGNYPTALFLTFGAVFDNATAKFGDTSVLFTGTGARTTLPPLEVATGANFSLEFWIYPVNLATANGYFVFGSSDSDTVIGKTTTALKYRAVEGSADLVDAVWQHVALTRHGGIVRMFLDGVKIIETVDNAAVTFGKIGNTTTGTLQFYIDSIGFSDNYCHYKETFQKPILPFWAEPTTTGVIFNPVSTQVIPAEASGTLLTPAEYDPHWRNVSLLVKGEGVNGSTNIPEAKNRYLTNVASVQCTTAQTRHNATSLVFSGLNYLSFVQDPEAFGFLYSDFTLDCWYFPTSTPASNRYLCTYGVPGDGNPGWSLRVNNQNYLVFAFANDFTDPNDNTTSTLTTITATTALTLNQWNFISVTLTGTVYRIHLNGVMIASLDIPKRPGSYPFTFSGVYVGQAFTIGYLSEINLGLQGYLEDFRITQGVSRYPTGDSYTVPAIGAIATGGGSAGDPYWTDVKALINFDEPTGTVYNVRDSKGHTVTMYGTSAVSGLANTITGMSPLFGNCLQAAVNQVGCALNYGNEFDLSSGDFCIELNAQITDVGSAIPLVSMSDESSATPANNRGWIVTYNSYGDSGSDLTPVGFVQWKQYDSVGVSDIAISQLGVCRPRSWIHVAVVRKGDDVQVFVNGKGGSVMTTSRRPHNLASTLRVGFCGEFVGDSPSYSEAECIDNFRFTKAARYKQDFIPPLGTLPEFEYVFGAAVITETYSLVPGSPRSASTVPGATIAHSYKLEIPKVVSPTFGFSEAMLPAAVTGGEGGRGNMLLQEVYNFLATYSEQVNLYFADAAIAQSVAGVEDTMEFGSTVQVAIGNVVLEAKVGFGEALIPTTFKEAAQEDGLVFAEISSISVHIGLGETISISALLALAKHAQQTDRIYVGDEVGTQFLYHIDALEVLGVSSDADYLEGMSLAEDFTLGSAAVFTRSSHINIASVVDLSSNTEGTIYLQVSLDDGLALGEAVTPTQLLETLIEEGVTFTAFMSVPSYTTWVMNTRSTAVSQYVGYQFNSFIKVGERYIGASDAGLYWLDGETDAGNPVLTTIQPGVIQPHGNKLARVLYAYLGMRGTGSFTFTVTDESGGAYTYKLDADSMKTGRVMFGKGMRTRYFTFKIESDGHDYDLDNIEFVTAETARKVQK